jgi:hypothetical protein
MVEYNLFRKKENAEKRAIEIGCKGSHKHGEAFMPCSTHKEWENIMGDTQKGEIEELIDYDGTMLNSKIPILDPALHPKKTTDQTVAATRITQDPLLRGFRVYYGESELKEVDMSDAFGYEETQDMDAEETIKFLEKEFGMEPEVAHSRAEEMGKSPERDKKSEFKDDKNFVGRPILKEKEIKIEEDILTQKGNQSDILNNQEASSILLRNAKLVKKLAEKEGISLNQLFKMIKSE